MCDLSLVDWGPILTDLFFTALGGFGGVFLGYWLAVRYDRGKKEQETKGTINLTKQILSNELNELKGEVTGYYTSKKKQEDKGGKGVFQPNIDLPTDGKDSIVNSGHFILLNNRLQRKISHIYSIVARAKALLPGLHDIHIKYLENTGKTDTQENLAQALTNHSKKFEIQIDQLEREIDKIKGELPLPEKD